MRKFAGKIALNDFIQLPENCRIDNSIFSRTVLHKEIAGLAMQHPTA